MKSIVDIDKTYIGSVSSYGAIQIRVVVLRPKQSKVSRLAVETPTSEPIEEESITDSGASPLSTYLETQKGKQCVVFLLNGQRHDAWDSTFISKDLGFKYLRTRTMIVVDLDGLSHEAISEIVQGSRQGLYAGKVMGAISDRIVTTLQRDPDLKRLQTEAEQEISELQAGDEVVRKQLDELIDAHHVASAHTDVGNIEPGIKETGDLGGFGKEKKQSVVIEEYPTVGDAGAFPVLVSYPPSPVLRLRPDQEKSVLFKTNPTISWANLEKIDISTAEKIDELNVSTYRTPDGLEARLLFNEPPDFDQEEYPLTTTLRIVAKIKDLLDLRVLELEVIINPVGPPPPPPPPPVLSLAPTFIKVMSRQPIKLISGGASTHVRLRWDGDDSLIIGAIPQWTMQASCLSLITFPPINFTNPKDGRFELLIDTPNGLISGHQLQFEVKAIGPEGQIITATFDGKISDETPHREPRRVSRNVPEPSAQRRPPYDLKYVHEPEWATPTCWGESPWTKDDVGAFSEPTESTPLTLIINEDAEGLKVFRDELLRRKLEETTIRERVNRYTAHVAFHLYQMYRFRKTQSDTQLKDEGIHVPTDEEQNCEIGRVATTLLKLMEISR